MFKTSFLIAWRNLLKDKLFSTLNLVGLSTGLACAFMIYLWVSDELQVDKYNTKDNQLFQVMVNAKSDQGIKTGWGTPGILAKAMATEIPEVEYGVTIVPASWFNNKGVVTYGDHQVKAGGQYIGKDYFKMFTCPFVDGDPSKVTNDKSAIAISRNLALKLFNTTKGLVGKAIKWDMGELSGVYSISGVFENNPSNATDPFDILLNYDIYVGKRPSMLSWNNSDPSTFLLLKEGTNIEHFNQKIRGFVKSKDKSVNSELFVIKFSDKYLHGQFENGHAAGGRIAYVRLFSIIALFILVIACINFMNLSTAKASRRMKEVGIKKVVGARRSSLIVQYLGESMLMSILSLILALGLVLALLPQFNSITGKQIQLDANLNVILAAVGITLFTGLIAGSYPALYLSGFKPVAVLKGKLRSSLGELWVRKGLVIFQFSLSVIFIITVMVIYRQTQYIQTRNLGYNRDHIIHFEIPFGMDSVSLSRASGFMDRVRNIPGVVKAGSYYHNLTGDHGAIGGFQWPGKNQANDITFANLEVGDQFIETAGIQIKEGRGFSNDIRAQKEIIFNESAIQSMGLKDPIGKMVKFWDQQRQIVGVVKDFNFESMYETVKPCFFQVYPVMPNIMVRIQTGSEQKTIAAIQHVFQEYNKGLVFDYQFLDENYQALYAAERRVGILSRYFAGLAIIISCLGLFGLAAFTAQRRQKEIGIRKVVGATVRDVVFMLSKDFLQLVFIAVLLAFPIAWWASKQWLGTFAYRVPFGMDIFAIAAFSILLITLITVSFQALRSALTNPVTSLRSE